MGDPEVPRAGERWILKWKNCLWALIFLLTVLVVVWTLHPHHEHARIRQRRAVMFQASEPLPSLSAAHDLSLRVRPSMTHVMRDRPRLCGVAAPNFRVYHRFLLLRHEGTGQVTEVFNPRMCAEQPTDAVNHTVPESSLMCANRTQTPRVRRSTVRVCHRDALWKEQDVVFTGGDAICLQHFMDVFAGHWPCGVSGEDRRMMPVVPRLTEDGTVTDGDPAALSA